MSDSPSSSTLHIATGIGAVLVLLATMAYSPTALAGGTLGSDEWQTEPRQPLPLAPDLPADLPAQLILDDDSIESVFGVSTPLGQARQFLWFNQFDLGALPAVQLEEIWVLFPASAGVQPGDAVELVVFHDADADPSGGATLLAAYDETVQVVDGVTFSVYSLPAPLVLPLGGNALIGVVPRFIVSGVTAQTLPAALDTTSSQSRSWVAVWSGDPPEPPSLPSDQFLDRIDVLTQGGNWAIRAFGTTQPAVDIPTLGGRSLALLTLLLAVVGGGLLLRRRLPSAGH